MKVPNLEPAQFEYEMLSTYAQEKAVSGHFYRQDNLNPDGVQPDYSTISVKIVLGGYYYDFPLSSLFNSENSYRASFTTHFKAIAAMHVNADNKMKIVK